MVDYSLRGYSAHWAETDDVSREKSAFELEVERIFCERMSAALSSRTRELLTGTHTRSCTSSDITAYGVLTAISSLPPPTLSSRPRRTSPFGYFSVVLEPGEFDTLRRIGRGSPIVVDESIS